MTLKQFLMTTKKENVMKFKPFVMVSSFLVLVTLIVCVSVYAYNAYAGKSINAADEKVKMWGAVNGWGLLGLDDGIWTISANVGTARVHTGDVRYKDGNSVSEWRFIIGSWNKSGNSAAYINGWDPTYTPIKKVSARGSASYDPRRDK